MYSDDPMLMIVSESSHARPRAIWAEFLSWWNMPFQAIDDHLPLVGIGVVVRRVLRVDQ